MTAQTLPPPQDRTQRCHPVALTVNNRPRSLPLAARLRQGRVLRLVVTVFTITSQRQIGAAIACRHGPFRPILLCCRPVSAVEHITTVSSRSRVPTTTMMTIMTTPTIPMTIVTTADTISFKTLLVCSFQPKQIKFILTNVHHPLGQRRILSLWCPGQVFPVVSHHSGPMSVVATALRMC